MKSISLWAIVGLTILAACGGDSTQPPTLVSITVAVAPATISIGQTAQATATLKGDDGTTIVAPADSLKWASSEPSIVTVSTAGVITALVPGTATITASALGKSGSGPITVGAAKLVVTTSPSGATSGANLTTQPVVEVQDALTSTKIATATTAVTAAVSTGAGTLSGTKTVNATAGVATFTDLQIAGTGAFTLTFTSTNLTAGTSVSFNVVPSVAPVASVGITPGTGSVIAGGSISLTATTKDASNNVLTGRVVTWNSSNSAVATVNSAGVVTGLAPGTVTVTATSETQVSPASNITIVPAVTGSVTLVGGGAVGGGTVDVLSGTTVLQTAAVTSGGTYSITSLAAGTYALRLSPPLTHSLGPSEPAQQPLTITVNQSASSSQPFAVQAALYSDDFQAYTNSTLLGGLPFAAGSIPAGDFWAGADHDLGATVLNGPAAPAQVATMDPTGGVHGEKAAKYDWLASPGTACTVESNVFLGPRIKPAPVLTQLWVRFTSKESANFEHGGTGCSNPAYKFFLVQAENGGTPVRFGTYLFDDPAQLTNHLTTGLYMDMSDGAGGHSAASPQADKLGDTWGGSYHTWVMGITGIGTASCSYSVYLDGVLIRTLTAPFNAIGGAGWNIAFAMGANMNNGPIHAESRWWRELAIYTTRPSLKPIP